MKTLITTLAVMGMSLTLNVNANETGNVEQVTAQLVKLQNQVVSTQVANQINQDIQFALRSMKMPKVNVDKSMLAKTESQKVPAERSE